MFFQELEWDSDFFHIRIARLNVDSDDAESDIVSLLQDVQSNYDLIYVFSTRTLTLSRFNSNCQLVDIKVVYQGLTNISIKETKLLIRCYQEECPNSDLVDLAYVSANYSRYKTDTRFARDDYKRLYKRWIEKSVNGTMADAVLCAFDNERITGMITLKLQDGYGIMGLVAVSSHCQGQGIGSALVQRAMKMLHEHGIEIIEVVTQFDNKEACIFYEQQGMHIKSMTNVYHWWC